MTITLPTAGCQPNMTEPIEIKQEIDLSDYVLLDVWDDTAPIQDNDSSQSCVIKTEPPFLTEHHESPSVGRKVSLESAVDSGLGAEPVVKREPVETSISSCCTSSTVNAARTRPVQVKKKSSKTVKVELTFADESLEPIIKQEPGTSSSTRIEATLPNCGTPTVKREPGLVLETPRNGDATRSSQRKSKKSPKKASKASHSGLK